MSVRTDVVNLIVNVGGNEAQNELNKLRKTSADLNSEMKSLNKNTTEYKQKAAQLKDVESQMSNLRKQIGLTALSQKELNAELNRLKALKNIATPQSKEFNELQKQIDAVSNRLVDVKSGMFGFKSTLSKIGTEVKQFGMLAAGYLGFEFITDSFKRIISGAGKMSDQLADLQRVAGLTAQETLALNQGLRAIDSRTSAEGLRSIAIIAGKLGVAKEDILSFTQAVDMLVVSLGDELGNADEITSQLGKILNVFDGNVNGENITELGNAMVTLANKGVATAGFIADFTQRVSGIAKASNLSLGATVGLAAGFEELGLRSESSSTALQKLLSTIAGDIPKAARIAGMDVKEFNKLFAEQPQMALIKYAEGLTKNKTSFAEITASFKDAGEEGARVVQTLNAIGQRGEFLTEKIKLGTEAIKENSAITTAFALKNETLGATLDKISKRLGSMFTNSVVANGIKNLVQGFSDIIGATEKADDALTLYRKQFDKVDKLEKNMIPLINRVEDLGKKTNISKTEQVELNTAIGTIASNIPSAILQFDNYGKAISISTERAKEYIRLQQLILKEKNREAITDQKTTIADLEKKVVVERQYLEGIQKELNLRLQAQKSLKGKGFENPGGGLTKEIERFSEWITKSQERLSQLQDRVAGGKGIIAELTGEELTKSLDNLKQIDQTTADVVSGETKEQKAARIKAEKAQNKANDDAIAKLKSLNDKIQDLKNEVAIAAAEDDEKEVLRIKQKYEKLLKEAVGYAAQIVELEKLRDRELQLNEVNGYKKREAELQKHLETLQQKWAEADKKDADEKKASMVQRLINYFKKTSEENEQATSKKIKAIQNEEEEKVKLKIKALEQFMYQVTNILAAAANYADTRENAELQNYLDANEKKKKSFDDMLKSHRISQAEHDRRVAALDKQADARKKEIDLKQFKRRQAIALINAIINAAEGITKIWATYAAVPYVAAALTAIEAIATGLEIATIAKQKPPSGRKGLVVQGPSHENGGIDMIDKSSGQTVANIEGGEPVMVLSRNTYGNNKELIDQLIYNSNHKNGAAVAPRWLNSTPSINPRMIPLMAQGGVVTSTASNAQPSYGNIEQLMATMVQQQQHSNELLSIHQSKRAYVLLQDVEQQQQIMNTIKKESGIKQS